MTLLNRALSGPPAISPGQPGLVTKSEKFLVDRNDPRRGQVEAFIARRFLEVHGARVSCFMPLLAVLCSAGGDVVAAVGIRDAATDSLFLEHYLDAPVERSIAECSGRGTLPPARESIAEIGNLASIDRRASRKLFGMLSQHLAGQGFEWAVFTGCSSLHRLFKTLGIETHSLGRALQSQLPADQQNWGSYYEDSPMVVAGRVGQGCEAFVDASITLAPRRVS